MKGCVCYYSLLRAKTHPRSRLSELNPCVQECLLEGQLTSPKTDRPKERRDKGEEGEKEERERGERKIQSLNIYNLYIFKF